MPNTEERLFQLCESFEKHVEKFEKHESEEVDKFNKLITAQQVNTDAISQLTKSVSTLVSDTGDIIQLHKDFQGTARIGKGVQEFIIWLIKWGAIGTAMAASLTWLIDYFGKG